VLLLAAGATRWLLASAHPEAEPTLASETLGCAWAALVSFALLTRRRAPQTGNRLTIRPLLSGAMIFGGPAIALLIGGRALEAGSLTIALALTPVVVAIAVAALETDRASDISGELAGRLWPGLAAVAGLLLVLAQPNLSDPRTDLALLLAPILTGLGAALFCAEPYSENASPLCSPLALAGASALFGIALLIARLTSASRPSLSLLAVACDGLLALLAILALNRLGPSRWSSQFTWLPLLILLEGLILMHPPLTARWVVGLLLLAAASAYVLLPGPAEADTAAPTFLP
jgi:drug/metabolite transporter (DMT)-like permease